jgi:IQ calmodulin-binding motif
MEIHTLALSRGANDPTKPDYSALIAKTTKKGGRITATSGTSASFGVNFSTAHAHRQKQETAAVHIQKVFRGWRQRVYNRLNALKYEVERKRERALAKCRNKAMIVFQEQVGVCLPCFSCFPNAGPVFIVS